MRTYKSIERRSTILGMPVTDLMLLLVALVGLVMLGSVISIFTPVSKYYYLCALGAVLGGYLVLRYANRNRHPSYLQAVLSFHFKQPKKISTFQRTDAYGKND